MRKTVLIVPGWLSPEGEESALRSETPALSQLVGMGEVERLAPMPTATAPEAAYFGLNPVESPIEQGPLTIAALGAEPPERSVHYQVDLMSLQDGLVLSATEFSPEELRVVWTECMRLETKRLSLLGSDRPYGGMVIEGGSPDMRISAPTELEGELLRKNLPKAEDEAALHRLIDDSINLLGELELNLRRIDEGKPPINLLWPWGGGYRPRLPNLAIQFGQTVRIESASIRMQGLARLVGWKHGDPNTIGRGTAIKFERMIEQIRANSVAIVVLDSIAEFRRAGKFEEIAWLMREMDRRLIAPIADDVSDGIASIVIFAPGDDSAPGISLYACKGSANEKQFPFDERAIDEQTIKMNDVWERVAAYLRWNPNS